MPSLVHALSSSNRMPCPIFSLSPPQLWVLAPRETKPIITLEFRTHHPGTFDGMIKVETTRDYLALPVSIRAVQGGLHYMPEFVDLGIITSPMQWRQQSIFLLNAEPVPVMIQEVLLVADKDVQESRAVAIFFRKQMVIPPLHEGEVATLTLTAAIQGTFRGRVLVMTNHTDYAGYTDDPVSVEFSAQVVHGSLYVNSSDTFFECLPGEVQAKPIHLENRFGVAFKVLSVYVMDPQFSVQGAPVERVVAPLERIPPFTVEFQAAAPLEKGASMVTHQLVISTNLTTMYVPLVVYQGRLRILPAPPPPQGLPPREAAGSAEMPANPRGAAGEAELLAASRHGLGRQGTEAKGGGRAQGRKESADGLDDDLAAHRHTVCPSECSFFGRRIEWSSAGFFSFFANSLHLCGTLLSSSLHEFEFYFSYSAVSAVPSRRGAGGGPQRLLESNRLEPPRGFW